jgi:hypothetical protein
MAEAESKELVVIAPGGAPALLPMPAAAIIVLRQTPNAAFAAEEFFEAILSNEHTRRAYGRIAGASSAGAMSAGLSCARSRPASPANTSVSSRARRPVGTRRWRRCGIFSTRWSSATGRPQPVRFRPRHQIQRDRRQDRRARHRRRASCSGRPDFSTGFGSYHLVFGRSFPEEGNSGNSLEKTSVMTIHLSLEE